MSSVLIDKARALLPDELNHTPVEFAPGVFWVGKRPPGQIFYANPYLVRDGWTSGGPGETTFAMLIDPGSANDVAIVRSKCEQVLGTCERLNAIFINHQDPDVCSSMGTLLGRYASRAVVVCSEDTWRLVQSFNISRDRFVPVDQHEDGLRTRTGRTLLPVRTPFCHFVGATMMYDPTSRVLFSGDLFGALTARESTGLFADEADWVGMRAFHQIYMPTNRALKRAIASIRALDPFPEVIAPQHGRIITGAWIEEFMERLEVLDVGLDILDARDDDREDLHAWNTVFQRVLRLAQELLGQEVELELVENRAMRDYISYEGRTLRVEHTGKKAVERAVTLLTQHAPPEIANPIKYEAVDAAHEMELPTPNIELEEDGSGERTISGGFEGL